MESLPNHPLTKRTASALDQSESIDRSTPILGLHDDPDEHIIGILLDIENALHVLGYTEETGWKQVETMTATADTDSIERAAEEVLDWATTHYERDQITMLSSSTNPTEELLSLLPDRPVGKNEVLDMDNLPALSIDPIFALEDTHEIIAVLAMHDHPDGTLATYFLGYTDDDNWQVILYDEAQPPEEPDLHFPAILDWVETNYDDFLAVDNRNRHTS